MHSQLPAGNDEDTLCQSRDMGRAVDRSCYYETVVYIVSRQTPGWDRAFDDTTTAIGEHNSTAGMIWAGNKAKCIADIREGR